MENASKALLIAGSILIAILLIAMGMRLFTSTQGTIDSAEGTMQAIQGTLFNRDMYTYIGEYKSYQAVVDCSQAIISHNASVKSDSNKIKFSLYEQYNKTVADPTYNPNIILDKINKIPTNRLYKIDAYWEGEKIVRIHIWIPDHY